MKRTKIVATIGPSSESIDVLERMITAGMNVARFNFSHGAHEWHKRVMQNVRTAAENLGTSVAVLADLQGPRVRTLVPEDLDITAGDVVRLCDTSTPRSVAEELYSHGSVVSVDCPGLVSGLGVGQQVLIEDGLMVLEVVDTSEHYAVCHAKTSGTIQNHKGVNVPGGNVPLGAMTKKDYDDLAFALEQDVDFVAMSFVRDGQDVVNLRQHMRKLRGDEAKLPRIIAKIERREALENLERIVTAANAVMVARGDLGVEIDTAQVALAQKHIVEESMRALRPVIVATQMLASMEHNPRPTRAEISDVTNAVIDHADAVMLSAESSVGQYPVEAIATMTRIAQQTEGSPYDNPEGLLPLGFASEEVRVAQGAYEFARETDAKAIVMYSESGYTARLLSHFRPERLLLVATNNTKTYRQLALAWGVIPVLCDSDDRHECIDALIVYALNQQLLTKDDLVVTVLGSTKAGKNLELTGTRIV